MLRLQVPPYLLVAPLQVGERLWKDLHCEQDRATRSPLTQPQPCLTTLQLFARRRQEPWDALLKLLPSPFGLRAHVGSPHPISPPSPYTLLSLAPAIPSVLPWLTASAKMVDPSVCPLLLQPPPSMPPNSASSGPRPLLMRSSLVSCSPGPSSLSCW